MHKCEKQTSNFANVVFVYRLCWCSLCLFVHLLVLCISSRQTL